MTKISIIIPVYNMDQHISVCLNSIFRQTLKDIEVICIDDGSTDCSLQVLYDFKKCYSNLIIICQKNGGSGIARNTGINNSSGEFLMFVDPDDYLASDDALEILYKYALEKDVKVCGGNLLGDRDGYIVRNFRERRMKNCFLTDARISFRDFQYPFAHQRFIIKKELLIDNNIYYPSYQRAQDIVFLARVLICVGEFYAVNKDVYIHRRGHKEVKFTVKKAMDFMDAISDVIELSIKNHLKEMFIIIAHELDYFAKNHWYKMSSYIEIWDKTYKINQLLIEGAELFQCSCQIKYLYDKEQYEEYCDRLEQELISFKQKLVTNKKFVIYGAGKWGKRIYRYLVNENIKPIYFVVSYKRENVEEIENIKVVSIDELENREEYLYILGNTDQEKIKTMLREKGCLKILEMDLNAFQEA